MSWSEKWVNLFNPKDSLTFKQRVIKFLTPKYTEQIRPGLFIKRKRGDNIVETLLKIQEKRFDEIRYPKYRQITPAAWNNKINWIVTILGANPIKSTAIFLFILFMAWAYWHDTTGLANMLNQFYKDPNLCFQYSQKKLSELLNLTGNITINNP